MEAPLAVWTTELRSGSDGFYPVEKKTVRVQVTSFVLAGFSEISKEPVTFVRLSGISKVERIAANQLVILSSVEMDAPVQRVTLQFHNTEGCASIHQSLQSGIVTRVANTITSRERDSFQINATDNSIHPHQLLARSPTPAISQAVLPSPSLIRRTGPSIPAPPIEVEMKENTRQYPAYAPRSMAGPSQSFATPTRPVMKSPPRRPYASSPILAPSFDVEEEQPPQRPTVPRNSTPPQPTRRTPIKIPTPTAPKDSSDLLEQMITSGSGVTASSSSDTPNPFHRFQQEREEKKASTTPPRYSRYDRPAKSADALPSWRGLSSLRSGGYVSRFASPQREGHIPFHSSLNDFSWKSRKPSLQLKYRSTSPLSSFYTPGRWRDWSFNTSATPSLWWNSKPENDDGKKDNSPNEKGRRRRRGSKKHQSTPPQEAKEEEEKEGKKKEEESKSVEKDEEKKSETAPLQRMSTDSSLEGSQHSLANTAQVDVEGVQQLYVPQVVVKHNIRGVKHPKEVYIFVTLDKQHIVAVKVKDYLEALETSGMLRRYRVQRRAVGDYAGEQGIPLVGVRDVKKAQAFFKGKCRALAMNLIVRVTLGTEELYVEQDAVLCRRPRFTDRSRLVCILTSTHGFFLEFSGYEKATRYADALNEELDRLTF